MPDEYDGYGEYVIQPNEYLLTIARRFGFGDVTAIVAANPGLFELCAGNYDVLPPGVNIRIPSKKKKDVEAPADQNNEFRLRTGEKYLRLTFQDEQGNALEAGWVYKLTLGGQVVALHEDPDHPGVVTTTGPLPSSVSNVSISLHKGGLHGDIVLLIGGLDPLVNSDEGRAAVQKILTNLGFFHGPADGNLGSESTRAALCAFQAGVGILPTGFAGPDTCRVLVEKQQNVMAYKAPPADGTSDPNDRNAPLFVKDQGRALADLPFHREPEEAGGPPLLPKFRIGSGNLKVPMYETSENVTVFSQYQEPEGPDRVSRTALDSFPTFPHQAYVAPCNKGEEGKNPNVIRMPVRQFVFLDTGRWLEGGRDFGVVWGRHTYLCNYLADGPASGHVMRPGLDYDFFAGMRGRAECRTWASARWAPDSDFDWDKIWVIVPDMHLMTTWIGKPWHGGSYDMQPEIDFLKFVRDLLAIPALQGKIRFIQIGDSYDLWVGCGVGPDRDQPLFVTNDQLMVVYPPSPPDPVETLVGWIKDIQGENSLWVLHGLLQQVDPVLAGSIAQRANPVDNIANPVRPGKRHQKDTVSIRRMTPEQWKEFEDKETWGNGTPLDPFYLNEVAAISKKVKAGMLPKIGQDLLDRIALKDGESEKWINPAEAGFRWLDSALGDDFLFIEGNHDNYLVDEALCARAGIKVRRRWFEDRHVFVEHGHRMEKTFADPTMLIVPHNYDGDTSGYAATISLYRDLAREHNFIYNGVNWLMSPLKAIEKPIADKWGLVHDQPQYWGELAQVWLGRFAKGNLEPPHICVIGHTHEPNLYMIQMRLWG